MKLRMTLALTCVATLLALAPRLLQAEDPVPPAFNAKHRQEGEQLLKLMRDVARVEYSKTGVAPTKLAGDDGCKRAADELKGKFFSVTDKVYSVGKKGLKGALTAEPVDANDGFCILVFTYSSGETAITWYDTFDALKKAQDEVDFGDDDAEEPTDTEASDAQAQWDALYKVGANWTLKAMGGMLIKTEVAEVKDGVAKIKTSINFGGNWMEPTDGEANRPEKETGDALADPNWKETAKGTDKFKVGELELDVSWVEGTYNGKIVRNTISTKYGFVVKAEYDGKVSIELTEFTPKD